MKRIKVNSEVTNAVGFKFGIEFEVPQVTSIDDAVKFYGGEAELLTRVNRLISRNAIALTRLRLMATTGESLTALHSDIQKARAEAKHYSPIVPPMNKANKAAALDNLMKNVDKIKGMSSEHIMRWLHYPELDDADWKIIDSIVVYWEKNLNKWR